MNQTTLTASCTSAQDESKIIDLDISCVSPSQKLGEYFNAADTGNTYHYIVGLSGLPTDRDVLSCSKGALANYSNQNGGLAVVQTEIKHDDDGSACYYLGTVKDELWYYDFEYNLLNKSGNAGMLRVETHAETDDLFRQTIIYFFCDKSASTPKYHACGEDSALPGQYYSSILTDRVCADAKPRKCGRNGAAGSGGLGTGGILLILFFVLVPLYFIGGALFQKFVKKETETSELLIHKEFWTSLPGLIKEGVMFTLNKVSCGKVGGSYSSL
jgi:hypothetical protein